MPSYANIFTIILFFSYIYGLGFIITSFLKNSENFLERNLMRMGIGLAILPFLGIILSYFRIPLDWRMFLFIGILYPLFYLIKNIKRIKLSFNITKYSIVIGIMLLIFLFNFYIYYTGAFDTASHIQYIHPYPPAYDMLLGILYQTSGSMIWTLKFFNALIISLSVIFLFFFVRQFTGNKNKALYASFILAMVPAYMSHFIWAIALTVPLYFVGFYCLERISEDKKWFVVSFLVTASVLTISPSHSTYYGLFLGLYFLTKTILQKKFLLYEFLSGLIGVILSFVFWWSVMLRRYGLSDMLSSIGVDQGVLTVGGTGDRIYTLGDFLFAKSQNLINSPVGIGLVVSLLTIISLVIIFSKYKKILNKENQWQVIVLVWFFFTLYAVNGARFPIKLSSFRAWPLFAIPVSILSAEAVNFMMLITKSIEQQFKADKILRACLIILIILGVWLTSGKQKFELNTANWPAGQAWVIMRDQNGNIRSPELETYLWLQTLPSQTRVFSFSNDGAVIALDKDICAWCAETSEIRQTVINKTGEEVHGWLNSNSYEYVILGQQEVSQYGANETNALLQRMISTQRFQPVKQSEAALVLKVV